jgi:hypothetical protein
MNTLTDNEYTAIKSGILEYGLNIAFLTLYDYERSEDYENCQMLDEAIKRFCQDAKLDYRKYNEDDIIENYKSDFWQFNLSGNIAFENIPYLKTKFRSIFSTIYGWKVHEEIYKQLTKNDNNL